jgi:hypothetical protein
MKFSSSIALFLIAICSYSTGVEGQNVYRCGNTYSQKPCADGVILDVQDARTSDQKTASDAQIKRDAATGNAMEKARLKEEAQQRSANAKLNTATSKKTATKASTKSSESTDDAVAATKTKFKEKSPKKKEPDYFIARVAPEKPKKTASASK